MGCQRRFFRFAGSISAPRRLLASRFLCRGCSIWNIIEYTLLAKLHLNSFARCASGLDSSIMERKGVGVALGPMKYHDGTHKAP